MKIRNQTGEFVQLGDVATVEIAEGPVAIRRVDQAHSVTFNVKYISTETLGQMTTRSEMTLSKRLICRMRLMSCLVATVSYLKVQLMI